MKTTSLSTLLPLVSLLTPLVTANPVPQIGPSFGGAIPTSTTTRSLHPVDDTDSMYGDVTYYYAFGTSSCGWAVDNVKHVAALSIAQQGIPASLCGRGITIDARGIQVNATVMDSCAGCEWGDVDVDERTFIELFGSTTLGRVENVQWWFNGLEGGHPNEWW